MDLGNFLVMRQELGLLAVFVVLLLFDIFAGERVRCGGSGRWRLSFSHCIPWPDSSVVCPKGALGGMYITSRLTVLMKNILNLGTLVVFMQAGEWLRGRETAIREGDITSSRSPRFWACI